MKIPSSFPRALSFRKALLPVTLGCAAISAHAADDFWNVAGPASWTDDANWSLGHAPTNADLAIIKNGGEATVGAGDTITVSNLRFINGTLTMTGGSIANTSDYIRIGDYAFDSTSGTANLTMSGSSSITGNTRVYIADGNNAGSIVSTANVTLSDTATITANNDWLVIGRQGGKATVELNDSAQIVKKGTTNHLVLGDGNAGEAYVTLNGNSQLKTENSEIYIGNNHVNAKAHLLVKDNAIVTKGGASGFLSVARQNATATLEIEGSGKVISQNHVRLGEGANANATLIMRENATMEIATRLETHNGGSNATVTMSDNAAMTISGGDTATIGAGNTAVVSFTLSDNASITGSNSKWKLGDFGGTGNTGSVSITLNGDSSLTLREMTVGHIGSTTATTTVTVNGNSTLKVNNFVTLGRDDANTNGGMNGRIILNGGTLATSSVRQGGIAAGAEPNASRNSISVNGGTIQALADEADFFQATANNPNRPYVYIDAGGLTFDTQEFSVGIQTVLHGTGDFTKIGGGILTLTGAQDYTGDTFVVDGTLSINTAYLADTSALYLYTGATLDLAFVGTDTIGALYINDVLQSVGVYDAGNLGGFLSGTGSLTVVPEPSVYAAGVLGVLAMSAYVRRRKALKA